MKFSKTNIPYAATGSFARIVTDYVEGKESLHPFFQHPVSLAGVKGAIEQRKNYPTNRSLLVNELKAQYSSITSADKVISNMEKLALENTFTITAAHQPNIFTGHLYFIYKILHAIKLAALLEKEFPENNFVPVFYMGSEDADLEELGHIYLFGEKYEWHTNQTGAVGRMKVDKALVQLIDAIAGQLTIEPFGKELIALMKECYTEGATIEEATFQLIHQLFAGYGLIVLLPDNPNLKSAFSSVIEKELTEGFSHKSVKETAAVFPKEYKVQASGREINLFYLKEGSRERIEKGKTGFKVNNTTIEFGEQEIRTDLKNNPEHFSPNVILRPVFQEMILPNIAFIGGGGEIAYWLELKKVFEAVAVPFPLLILRNSFLIVEENQLQLMGRLNLTIKDLFRPEQDLLNELVKRESSIQLSLDKEKLQTVTFYQSLMKITGNVDISLVKHTENLLVKALNKIEALEKKMLKAEKKKFEVQQRQIHKLRSHLFPHNNLQERIENFMPFYAKWGKHFIDLVYQNSPGLEQEFIILDTGTPY